MFQKKYLGVLLIFLFSFFVNLNAYEFNETKTIIKSFQYKWTGTMNVNISNVVISDASIEISNITNVLIVNSQFRNVTINIYNVSNLILSNSLFNESNIVSDTTNTTINNNSFYDYGLLNSCINILHELQIRTLYLNYFDNIHYSNENTNFVGTLRYFKKDQNSVLNIKNNTKYFQKSDAYQNNKNFCSNQTVNEKYLSIYYIDLNQSNSLIFKYNTLNVITGMTTQSLHSTLSYIYRSLLNIDLLNQPLSLIDLSNNTMIVNHLTLPPPVKYGISFKNSSYDSISSSYQDFIPSNYQDLVYHIYIKTPELNAYNFDIEIDKDNAKSFEDCHYLCKKCDACYLTDNSLGQEFSVLKNGVCFNKQVFTDVSNAVRLCRHEKLRIKGPITYSKSLVFSTMNKYTNTLKVTPLNENSVSFNIAQSSTMDDFYKYTIDPVRYNLDVNNPDFVGKNNFILLINNTIESVDNGTIIYNDPLFATTLENLEFIDIRFTVNTDLSQMSLFSFNSLYSSNYSTIKTLGFNSCNFTFFGLNDNLANYIISNISLYSNHGSYIILIENLVFQDSIFESSVFSDSILNVVNLTFKANTGYNLKNGLLSLNVSNVFIEDNICISCDPNSFTKSVVYLDGNQNTNLQSIIKNNQINSSIESFQESSYYKIMNYNQLIFESNSGSEVPSIGLSFSNITSFPCNYPTLLILYNLNTNLNGYTHDFLCNGLSCKDETCFDNLNFNTGFCIVNKTTSINDPLYRIKYYRSLQDAINRCIARNIFVVPEYVYVEQINFKNLYNGENLTISSYTNENFILSGNSHTISGISNTKFNLKLKNVDFVNTNNFLSSETSSTYILYTPQLINGDLYIEDSNFYSSKPLNYLVSISNITEYRNSISLIRDFSSNSYPNIKGPNTDYDIYIISNGTSFYNNIELFGSFFNGIFERKISTLPIHSTTLNKIRGYNMWSSLTNLESQINVSISLSNCDYFCGGLTPLISYSIIQVSLLNPTNLYILNNSVTRGPDPLNNSYVISRFPNGNPFRNELNLNAGLLAGVWVMNLRNTSGKFDSFLFRNNFVKGYPIGVRIDGHDNSVLDTNNNLIYLNDDKRYPRQIIYSNNELNPLNYMSGNGIDVKFGPIQQDSIITSTNNCHQMCLPSVPSQVCTINTASVQSASNYHSLKTAISNCPYSKILILDFILEENIDTDLVYLTRLGSNLEIYSYGSSTIVGNHTIQQNCLNSNVIPNQLIFKSLIFRAKTPVLVNTPLISIKPISLLCVLGSLRFENVQFNVLNTSFNNFISAIECDSCNLRNLTLINTSIRNGFKTGLYVSTPDSPYPVDVLIQNSNFENLKQNAIYANLPRSLKVTGSTLKCESETNGIGCTYIYSYPENILFFNNRIETNGKYSGVKYSSLVWNIINSYTLPEVYNVTSGFYSNDGDSTKFGLQLIVKDINNYYPCNDGDQFYINEIAKRNPYLSGRVSKIAITDDNGVILNNLEMNYGRLYCFIYTSQNSGNGVAAWIIFIGISLIFIALIYLIVIRGVECLYGPNSVG